MSTAEFVGAQINNLIKFKIFFSVCRRKQKSFLIKFQKDGLVEVIKSICKEVPFKCYTQFFTNQKVDE